MRINVFSGTLECRLRGCYWFLHLQLSSGSLWKPPVSLLLNKTDRCFANPETQSRIAPFGNHTTAAFLYWATPEYIRKYRYSIGLSQEAWENQHPHQYQAFSHHLPLLLRHTVTVLAQGMKGGCQEGAFLVPPTSLRHWWVGYPSVVLSPSGFPLSNRSNKYSGSSVLVQILSCEVRPFLQSRVLCLRLTSPCSLDFVWSLISVWSSATLKCVGSFFKRMLRYSEYFLSI